jgi:hypothetical protein
MVWLKAPRRKVTLKKEKKMWLIDAAKLQYWVRLGIANASGYVATSRTK